MEDESPEIDSPGGLFPLPMPKPGSDFYYATRYIDPKLAKRLWSLEAFRREITAIPLTCSDRGVARVKLHWWQLEIARLEAGEPQHGLSKNLAPYLGDDETLITRLQTCVAAVDTTLEPEHFTTHSILDSFLQESTEIVWREVSHSDTSAAGSIVLQLSGLIAYAYIICELRAYRRANLIPIPLDLLSATGLSLASFHQPSASDAINSLVGDLCRTLITDILRACRSLKQHSQFHYRAILTLAHIVTAILKEIEAIDGRVFECHVDLTPIRKLAITLGVRTRFL